MTIRTIRYLPKITSARTTYVDIDKGDMTWLQTELIRYLSVMGELSVSRNEDVRAVLKTWWEKRTATLPKGIHGQNTPRSFVAGLLNNLMFGSQNNLSTIQMDAIQNITAIMVQFLDAVSAIDSTFKGSNDSVVFQIAIK